MRGALSEPGRFVLDTSPLSIELHPGSGRVRGRVVDDRTGEGVAGARVVIGCGGLGTHHRVGDRLLPDASPFEASTSKDGGFDVEGLYPLSLKVCISHVDYAILKDTIHVGSVEAPSEYQEFRLERPLSLRGYVRSPDGKPVPECRVTAKSEDGLVVRAATDPEGSFRLEGLSAGGYELMAVKLPLGRVVRQAIVPSEELELVLSDEHIIARTITDADGTPLAGAKVGVRLRREGETQRLEQVLLTGEDGRFCLISDSGPEPVELAVFHAAKAPFPDTLWPIELGTRDARLALPDASAEPASLRASCKHPLRVTQDGTGLEALFMSDRGELSIGPLPAGAYTVDLQLQWPKTKRIGTYVLAPGQNIDLGSLQDS